jgi:FkbM family methyltransferase
MRKYLKQILHFLIKRVEMAQEFYLPDELPAQTKLSFLSGNYEPETSRYIRAHVKGGVAIDVGAHVGYYSRLLSPLADVVYAFEPDPANFALLVKNTKRYKNIVPVNTAVSDAVGEKPLYHPGQSTFRPTLENLGGTFSTTKTTTIDEFMADKNARVSFVKIDVEGHEQSVLAGMQNTVDKDHPLVIAEMPINDKLIPVSPPIGKLGLVRNYII